MNAIGLFVATLAIAGVQDPPEGTPPTRRNVVLIMADDSAVDTYGAYGSTFFSTPRLDALAREGARFDRCYSTPVCTPSRVAIMTGRRGLRNYVRFGTLDSGEVTFGTMMKGAGYTTAVAGKWQLHGDPSGSLAPDCGFDTYCLWNYPGTKRPRYWGPSIVRDGGLLETTKADYGPDIFTDFVIDFIDANQERAFFVYYPMTLVHSPFLDTPDSAPTAKKEEGARLRRFRDMVAYADKCVGRIVDALEERGLRESTLVLFTADNGTDRSLTYPFADEQRKGEKAFATEGGTHVPLIVNCPGTVPPGIDCGDLVEFADFLPTLAEATGADLPDAALDGRSFWPQCRGRPGNPREWIVQYYYPKFAPAAEAHGQGVQGREIAWVQDRDYKLYRDGSLYAVADRYETAAIEPGVDETADAARQALDEVLRALPEKAAKLDPPQR